jgi:DNA primase
MSQVSFTEAAEMVKANLDIVALVQRHVPLKKQGRAYRGLCPFHPDKSPSMDVNREKGVFICRACGVGGGALNFVMQLENKTYSEVIFELAEEQGITILQQGYNPEHAAQQQETKKRIATLNQQAMQWFYQRLQQEDAKIALHYLQGRYPDPETCQKGIEQFKLGYAPAGWEHLTLALKQENSFLQASPDLLVSAGLSSKREHATGYYDRFRNRLIIPILDERGQVVAFGGRVLDSEDNPKYLNSPETVLYKKSNLLYGAFQARETIKETGTALVMEGYFDVMSAHLAGITQAVGSCGTALTPAHVKLLARLGATTVILSFDADEAGINAASSAINNTESVLQSSGIQMKVFLLPQGKDPDEFITGHGGKAFEDLVAQHALPYREFQLSRAIVGIDTTTPEGRIAAADRLTPILGKIGQPTVLSEYTRLFATRINISEEALTLEVRRYKNSQKTLFQPLPQTAKQTRQKQAIYDSALLSLKRNQYSSLPEGTQVAHQKTVEIRKERPAWLSRQLVAEENILKLILFNLESFSIMMDLVEQPVLALFQSGIYRQILADLLDLGTELKNTDTSLENIVKIMNTGYAEKKELLHPFAALLVEADNFGESIGLAPLTGTALQSKLHGFSDSQVKLMTLSKKWTELGTIYQENTHTPEEEIEKSYRLNKHYHDQLTESPHIWGNIISQQPSAE